MKKREKYIRFFSGLVSMLLGTSIVLSIIILINDSQLELEKVHKESATQIKFNKRKPKSKQVVKRQKPKPKIKKAKRVAPAPIMGLNSQLSGVDLGLPEFSMAGLNSLDGDILGNGKGIVMTDDTVDRSPKAIYQSPVTYPARARAKGIEGYVVFSLLIGITGEIEQAKIVESSPTGLFDDAATQSMQAWKFEPAQYQGQAVKTWAKQRIRFDLS
ncbi:MAG: energy transducer TonB [Alcanivoracaceae bacterium]|nr:energy transducer TonB [Alcanivoracaceae bacterium]